MSKEIRIKYSSILILILILILLPPSYFSNFDVFAKINEMLTIVLFIVLTIYTLFKKKINIYVLLIVLFLTFNMYTSYFLLDGVLDLYNNLKILSIVLLINLIVSQYTLSLLKSLYVVFYSYILLNTLSYILFPNGLYLDNPRDGEYREAWFLGIENQFAYYIIPGVILIFIYDFYRNRKITYKSWIAYTLALITIFLAWSATAVVSFLFLTISIIIVFNKINRKLYSFFTLSIIYIFLWFSIIRINNSSFFQFFIENFLGKDMTFSSRTVIWERVFEYIEVSKWIGHGNNTYVAFTNREFRAHNMILQIILDNGLISLFLFILIFIIVGFKAKRTGNLITTLIIIGIFSILIGGLTEAYRMNNLFLLLTLGYFNKDIWDSFIKLHQINKVEGYKL